MGNTLSVGKFSICAQKLFLSTATDNISSNPFVYLTFIKALLRYLVLFYLKVS